MSPSEEGRQGPTLLELARQALSSTEVGYDLLAPKFDQTPFRTPDAVIERTLAASGDVLDALDLCCGTGAGLAQLLPQTRRRLVGVDLSQGMLDQARAKLGLSLGLAVGGDRPRVELVKQDVFAITFDTAFDLVTCFGAFGHIPEADEATFVRLVRRALRPGGRFVFVTSERPAPWSKSFVVSKAFNAAMRVRNAVVSPPFVMYYLTFVLPDVARLLRWEGFDVEVKEEVRFERPFEALRIVVATRRA